MLRSDTDPNAVQAANPDLFTGCAVLYNVGPRRDDNRRSKDSGIVYQAINGPFFCVWDSDGSVSVVDAGDAAVMEVLEGDRGRDRDEREDALEDACARDDGEDD